MIDLLQNLAVLQWRRSGAVIRDARIAGSRVWYAEFPPSVDACGGRRVRRPDGDGAQPGQPPPALLLVHGMGASSMAYHQIIPFLRSSYRLIVPDLPGNGLSPPPAGREFLRFPELVDVVEALTAKVAPGGALVAGHSVGGWIAVKLAARCPDLIRGIALISPSGPALTIEEWSDFFRVVSMLQEDAAAANGLVRHLMRRALKAADGSNSLDELMRRTFHKPPAMLRLVVRDLCRIMRGPAVVQLLANLKPEDYVSEQEARRVRCPAILVWGERDRLIPEGCRTFYLQTLTGVRHEPIADCGHSALQEQPRRTAEILLQLRHLASGPAPDAAESARAGRGAGDGARLPGARGAPAVKGASTAGSGSRAKSVR